MRKAGALGINNCGLELFMGADLLFAYTGYSVGCVRVLKASSRKNKKTLFIFLRKSIKEKKNFFFLLFLYRHFASTVALTQNEIGPTTPRAQKCAFLRILGLWGAYGS